MLVNKIARHQGNWTTPPVGPSALNLSACLEQARIKMPNVNLIIMTDLFRAFEQGVRLAQISEAESVARLGRTKEV